MTTAETLGFSPEQQQAYRQIAGFFGRADKESPAAAKQLVNVVGGLVGDQQTTRMELQDGMKNIDVGLALIGDWLKETGAEGFVVVLGFGGGAKKAIGRSKVNFPTASDLIRVKGRVDPELQRQIPPLLSSFSRQIRGGLDVGLSPRQIVGGLVAESVGSKLSASGSANLREALEKPLGGHFEWIREALGIGDVAARELAGRIQKEAMIGEVKAASPAFLKKDKITGEYELPEGYETVELGFQEERLIPLDKRTGTALIYIENVGFRFTREGGIVHVRPTGFSWPNKSESLYGKALIIPAAGIPISEAGYLQRICVASNNSSNLKMYGGDRDDFVSLDIPDIDESQQGMPLLGLFRIDISIRKGHIKIENFNWKDRISLDPDFIKISVPAAARGEEIARKAREQERRRAGEALVVPEKPAAEVNPRSQPAEKEAVGAKIALEFIRPGAWGEEYEAIQSNTTARLTDETGCSRIKAVLALELEDGLLSGRVSWQELDRTANMVAFLAKKFNLPLAGKEGLNTDVRRLAQKVLELKRRHGQ